LRDLIFDHSLNGGCANAHRDEDGARLPCPLRETASG
jgi:hypothetical protein